MLRKDAQAKAMGIDEEQYHEHKIPHRRSTALRVLTDIEGVRDVIALGQLLKHYDGTKFTCPDDEPEIGDHDPQMAERRVD